jgi:hypothetical protein
MRFASMRVANLGALANADGYDHDRIRDLMVRFDETKVARYLVPKLCVEVGWCDCFVWSSKVFGCFSI